MAEKIELDLKADDLVLKLQQAEAAYASVVKKEAEAQKTARFFDELQRKGLNVGQKKEGQITRAGGKADIMSPISMGMSAIGLIPGVGPTLAGHAKAAMDLAGLSADMLIPIVKGLLQQGLLADAIKATGLGTKAIEDAITSKLVGGLSAVQESVNKIRSWDEAFRPTWERMKEVARLRSLAGTTMNTADAGKMYSFLFDLNKAETTMQRKMDQRGREMLVRSIAGSIEKSLHE